MKTAGDALKLVLENQGYEKPRVFNILYNLFRIGAIPVGLWWLSKYAFSLQVKREAKDRAGYKSEITSLQPERDDPLNVHHINPQYKGGKDSLDNALVVLQSEHREIHLIEDKFDMRKYNPNIKDCTDEQSESVWQWILKKATGR